MEIDLDTGIPEQNEIETLRERASNALHQMKSLLDAIKAPLPTETGDGSNLPPPQENGFLHNVESILKDIKKLGLASMKDLAEVQHAAITQEPLNDRDYLMEGLIRVRPFPSL